MKSYNLLLERSIFSTPACSASAKDGSGSAEESCYPGHQSMTTNLTTDIDRESGMQGLSLLY